MIYLFLFAELDFGLNVVISMEGKKDIVFEACKKVIVFCREAAGIALLSRHETERVFAECNVLRNLSRSVRPDQG